MRTPGGIPCSCAIGSDSACSDYAGIYAAIAEGKKNTSQPTLIRMRTIIGYGSTEQGTGHVHGARECSGPTRTILRSR